MTARSSHIESDAASKGRRSHLAGDNTFVLFDLMRRVGEPGAGAAGKANFAVGSVSAKSLGELQFLASLAGLSQACEAPR